MKDFERRRWDEFEAIVRECVRISEGVWTAKLAAAEAEQQALAERMRDRTLVVHDETSFGGAYIRTDSVERDIPTPLFTPRDRLQFLKEFTTTVLISADRRNLTVTADDAPLVVPFGKFKGVPITDLDAATLSAAAAWAAKKKLHPEFVEAVEALAKKRAEAETAQPLDAVPVGLQGEPEKMPYD